MEYTTKCRIYPNKEQQIQIAKTFGCCRFVWNHYLVLREFFYRNCITKDDGSELWTKFDSIKDLVFLKDQYPWLCEADAIALQATVEDIDRAYQNFFRGCKTGKRIGYPRFKTKRNPKQSYRTKAVGNNIQIDYEHGRVKLRKLGWVKIRLSKRVSGRILNATVSKNASGKYFLAICWTDVRMHSLPATGQTTGIDLGLKDLAVFSDGRKIDNIRVMKQGEARLARAQRRLSRKQKGSHRYAKQAKRVAVIHEKISNQRSDWNHKLTAAIIREYDTIGIEDLNIKGLLRNHKSAKSISDAGWGEIRRQLEYKSQWYGRNLVIADRFFPSSQTCHCCGYRNPEVKDSKIRSWICPDCHTVHDRDVNAAINLKEYALSRS